MGSKILAEASRTSELVRAFGVRAEIRCSSSDVVPISTSSSYGFRILRPSSSFAPVHASPPAQNSSTLFQLRASAAQPARPRLSGHSVSARKLVPVYPTLPNSFLVIPCPPNALTFFVTRSMHPDPQRHTQLFMPVRGFPKGSRFPFPCRVRFFSLSFLLTFSC